MNPDRDIKFSTIEYISNSHQDIIIDEAGNNKLSPLSLSLLDSILSKKITVICSQGSFNLTPIISCIFALKEKQDVLITIPKHRFDSIYNKNTKIYFSLLYKKKIDSIATSSPFYFYDFMIWCKGRIDEDKNELNKLDVETHPKKGTLSFKQKYEHNVKSNLASGEYQEIPMVVSIPVDHSIPVGVIGEKEVKFKTEKYKLDKFDPKLIIYESINERNYNFEHLLNLIKKIERSNRKLVLHFSWPYLRGLTNFLRDLKDDENVAVFHFGKRLCLELKENFQRPPQDLLPLSLEGDIWDNIYYHEHSLLSDFMIILPSVKSICEGFSIEDLKDLEWEYDNRVKNIRQSVKVEGIDGFKGGNILKFPPVIDTFLYPSEVKNRTFLRDLSGWRFRPISDYLDRKLNEDSRALMAFHGLCVEIEQCRDIAYEIKGLRTNSAINKRTLLQTYILEGIETLVLDSLDRSGTDSDVTEKIHLILANLHPYLGTKAPLIKSLEYFFESVAYAAKTLKLSEISDKIIGTPSLDENDLEIFLGKNDIPIEISISKNDDTTIKVVLSSPVEYIKCNPQRSATEKKSFMGLTIYSAIFKKDSSYKEYYLSEVLHEKNKEILKWVYNDSMPHPKQIIRTEIQIEYHELSKVQRLPIEMIKNSELLIPGPIPFHTISKEEILVSQGYDALLYPFKKITFFAYPGDNFSGLLKEIKLYNDLYSETPTNIARRDIQFSLGHTEKSNRFNVPPKPEVNDILNGMNENDTPIDDALRQELLDADVNEDEKEVITTLRDIWDRTYKNHGSSYTPHGQGYTDRGYLSISVEFEGGERETLKFPAGAFIRRKVGAEYFICSVEELEVNDEIIYIQTDDHVNIDDFLLREILSEADLSLEKILEPLTCLKRFYESLKSIKYTDVYDEIKMEKMYWLSETQRENVFDLVHLLLNGGSTEEISNLLNSNSIWKDIIKEQTLVDIFKEGRNVITYAKLYNLVREAGLKDYKKDSFKSLCSIAIHEAKHYSFHKDTNLRAIGSLIGYQDIIDNYQILNEQGSRIKSILQQIGWCIKRVVNGEEDPFNEMDVCIEGKMKKCKVIGLM